MKKSYLVKIPFYILIVSLFLLGCGGGGPGSPGSQGTEDTGVILDATITPTYNGTNTYSVDAVQQVCSAGPPAVYETFTDHSATVTINVRLVNPKATFTPGTLYIEKYTVEFRRAEDSIGAPPIQSDTRYKTIVITPPTGSGTNSVTATVILVDLTRKSQYYSDMTSGRYGYSTSAYLNNYTATYTFEGQNQYGTGFSFKAQTDFQIGSFDNCT